MGTLYVVATPIGNIEDITLRALNVLKAVDLIAAEDTRHTRKLLSHYGIRTPLTSYHEHNERRKGPWLIERLKEDKNIALVSDAGTPAISDPGYRLVRLAAGNSMPVSAIPGPSALTAILSVAGLPTDEFTFKGFIPPAGGERKRFFLELKKSGGTFIMYESPRRIKAALADMEEALGGVPVVIAREMTKLYEEIIRGDVRYAAGLLKDREVKGELTIVLNVAKAPTPVAAPEDVKEKLAELFKAGLSLKDAVKTISDELEIPKSYVYKEALKLKET